MLQSISVENYAIIAKVTLDFDERLNIITGETGAGKSILLGALGLIMGQRADSKVLLDKANKCIVEASFSAYPKSINVILEANDLDQEDELIIRREIVPSGRSRAFINDTPTNLDVLQSISTELIDLNKQFQITDIQRKEFHLKLVDALAGNEKLNDKYTQLYTTYRQKSKELDQQKQLESAQLKEVDFMQFQLNEFLKIGLVDGEKVNMESEATILEKSDEISALMQETTFKLSEGDDSVKDLLLDLSKRWATFNGVNPQISEGYELLEELQENLISLTDISQNIADSIDSNPARLSEIRLRLDEIYSLEKKHGVQTVSQLMTIQSELEQKLANINGREARIKDLEKEIASLEQALEDLAAQLTKKRKKIFKKLESSVNTKLDALAMDSAEIKVSHQILDELKSSGKDDISIRFKANKGSDFQEIKKVASGGETSRLMLSIKATVAKAMSLPTMIFDEIDTGVSGDIAGKMALILKELATDHQMICITHTPQIAARAIRHFHVFKEEHKNRTETHVRVLNDNERITEIAKMLSGDPPSTFALDNAKDLMTTRQL